MRHRTHIVIALSVVAAACRGRAPIPQVEEPERSPNAVYAEVRRREAHVQTLRARFAAHVRRGREVRNADGILLVKKPDRFRLRLLSPFGLTVFDYTSWDGHDRMELPLEGKAYADGEIADHSPFSPTDMRHVFLRSTEAAACSAQGTNDVTVVDCRTAGELTRLLRISNATLTVVQEIHFAGGQPKVIMQFDDHRRVGAVVLPFKIELTYPGKDVHLEITVRSYEVNPALGDDLFDAAHSSGAGS